MRAATERRGIPLVLTVLAWTGIVFVCLLFVIVLTAGVQEYSRWQFRLNEQNQIQVNAIRIQQQEQLIQVEQQKAQIRIVEAGGIAESQKIINATLTDKYLQHEAIQAQLTMANSPNHTTIYIPSGQNGIPIVNTISPETGAKP